MFLAKGKIAIAFADGGLHPKNSTLYYRHKIFTEKQFGKIDGNPVDAVGEKIASGYYTDLGIFNICGNNVIKYLILIQSTYYK